MSFCWADFIKRLAALDVFWGRRSKMHHGLYDGGAAADAIGDPTKAVKINGRSIFNVNHPDIEPLGGHFHDLTVLNENEALYVRAIGCRTIDVVGDWVRVVSDNTVNRLTDNTHSNVLGVIVRKPTTTTCDVITAGRASIFTGLVSTSRRYFLSTSGGMATVPPTTGHVIELGKALNPTNLYVHLIIPMLRNP